MSRQGVPGRKCPRFPDIVLVGILAAGVRFRRGDHESLELDHAYANAKINGEALWDDLVTLLPTQTREHTNRKLAAGTLEEEVWRDTTMRDVYKAYHNRLVRFFNKERKVAEADGTPEDKRGMRSKEHPFNWPDWKKYEAFYEHACRTSAKWKGEIPTGKGWSKKRRK